MQIPASRKPFTRSMSMTDDSRGGLQALLTGTSNALTSVGEPFNVNGLFPPGEVKEHYCRVGYSQFINAEGSQLPLNAERYRADPNNTLQLDAGFQLAHRTGQLQSAAAL